MNELDIEKKKLKDTIDVVDRLLEEETEDLNVLYNNHIGSRDELFRLANIKKVHINNLSKSKEKPYFARIDFKANDDDKTMTMYIGKNGITDNTDIIVTDWRAPISSLYYDAEIGKCSYEAPEGVISGEMSLKRQFDISHGELLNYFDVDLVSNDLLLQEYLKANNDSRTKSIVATIQKEQNDVIRRKLSENLIIQGVAGSGKTTVALHRIAYLVYNYMKKIRQNQFIVIGPNPVFLKYIKSVLPDLDVSDVEQYTYEDFVKNYLKEDINIIPSDKKVNASLSGNSTDIDKFKCSIKFKNMIDAFINVYMYGLTNNDFMLGDFLVLPSSMIKDVFDSTSDLRNSNLNNRVSLTIERLCRYIEDNNEDILSNYNSYTFDLFSNAKTDQEKEIIRSNKIKHKAEIEKNCRNALKKYFSKAMIDSTKLYKLFISSITDFDLYNYKNISQLKKDTNKNIKSGNYEFEDLAALLYIKSIISPNVDYKDIRHIVLDEAQDLGEFNFYSLKKCLPSASFSIFGDLAQSIYDYRSIDNWDSVNSIVFDNSANIVNFNKSYRTTSEIMDVADDIAESLSLGRSDEVIRHGEPVKFTEVDSYSDIASVIIEKIKDYKAKGYKSIAIVSKTNLLSNYLNDDLNDLGFVIPNVTNNDDLTDDRFSICTISNQLVKGLEFDAVIINNPNEEIYSSDNNLDMKLLYVALTRALHELDIVYSGNITRPLERHVGKKLTKSYIKKRYL